MCECLANCSTSHNVAGGWPDAGASTSSTDIIRGNFNLWSSSAALLSSHFRYGVTGRVNWVSWRREVSSRTCTYVPPAWTLKTLIFSAQCMHVFHTCHRIDRIIFLNTIIRLVFGMTMLCAFSKVGTDFHTYIHIYIGIYKMYMRFAGQLKNAAKNFRRKSNSWWRFMHSYIVGRG
jgi:hypothetical protein